ncbi:MAG: hypothetical protein WD875_03270 [Pirellulales bacterium]
MIRHSSARLKSAPQARPRIHRTGRQSAKPAAATKPLELEPQARRGRSFWVALFTVLVFAAGFWQFALLDVLAPAAADRVNDGREATFFAVHINPYYVFSEDFHLYVVRAKRILDRGWTDSPLAARDGEKASYAAPVQAALGMIAVQTDGKPVPYTAFMFGVIAAAWCGLFLAARRWMPQSVSTRSILVAVFATVLFESIGGLAHRELEYAQWPVHRGLRLSTMAWTSPLVLVVALASSSLLFDRRRIGATVAAIGVVLLVLAGSDNWAFVVASATTGVVAGALLLTALVRIRRGMALERWKRTVGLLALALGAAAATHQLLGGGMTGDVLARGGMGKAWLSIPEPPDAPAFWGVLRRYVWCLVAMAVAACVTVRLGGSRVAGEAWARITLSRIDTSRLPILAVAAAPLVAVLALVPTLVEFVGMEEYHAYQFIWRAEYCLIFAVVLLASEWIKLALRHFAPSPSIAWRLEIVASALVVIPLLGYHNFRIYNFVSRTAASEFFLTEDEEHLRDWLRLQPTESIQSLATASHELNYLCAYWTNADLLLPEGFPYHNGATNDEIEDRMADLLRLYRANPDSWIAFNQHGHSDDQWSWHESRLRSAREGYSYYLMHRGMSLAGNTDPFAWARNDLESGRGTTARMAEVRRREDRGRKIKAEVQHGTPIAAIEMTDRIAKKLADRDGRSPPQPDVIIVDEVSRALGMPDFAGYTRAFTHGSLEAWTRDNLRSAEHVAAAFGRTSP